MIKLPSLTQIKDQLKITAKRFPLPTLCAVITTYLGIYLVHQEWQNEPDPWVWKTLLTATLGLIALSALTLAAENLKSKTRGLVMLGGVALLALYYWSIPSDNADVGSMWIIRHVFLSLASLSALVWAPSWHESVDNKKLWHWCSQLIANFVVTGFFAVVLYLGIIAAFFSIDALFGVDLNEKWYLDTWILIAGLFSPLFLLSNLDQKPLKLKVPKSVDPFMKVFTKYIMTPLATGYLVILYTYTAKILLTWEWPKGVLGWLVICFLGVAIFTYFLWTPLFKPAFEKYRRIFWLILLPQIFLLFVAIGWRIHAYSWTENRYFVVILGLWLLGTTIYFLLKKNARFKWIFVALTALILVSQIGPLSGYEVGKRAQSARLMTLLEEANIKDGTTFIKSKIDVNNDTENEVASILDYLIERHGKDYPLELLPGLPKDDTGYYAQAEIMEDLGLVYRSKWERRSDSRDNEHFSYNLDYKAPRNISGYDWRITSLYAYDSSLASSTFPYKFQRSDYKKAPTITVLKGESKIETIDLKPSIDAIIDEHKDSSRTDLLPQNMRYEHENNELKLLIFFTNIYGEADQVNSFDVEVYVRIKE